MRMIEIANLLQEARRDYSYIMQVFTVGRDEEDRKMALRTVDRRIQRLERDLLEADRVYSRGRAG